MSGLKPFNLARTALLTFIDDLNEESLDFQSPTFENTIRWHIGNVLLATEKLLFINRDQSQGIPKEYAELFSSDVKVADWKIEPPTLEKLMEDLINQQERINGFSELFWKSDIKFKVPNGNVKTHGDVLIMLSIREAEALGKIKVMKQIFDANKK